MVEVMVMVVMVVAKSSARDGGSNNSDGSSNTTEHGSVPGGDDGGYSAVDMTMATDATHDGGNAVYICRRIAMQRGDAKVL
eukprot:14344882-Alexandrium_andersonii.AAC.1